MAQEIIKNGAFRNACFEYCEKFIDGCPLKWLSRQRNKEINVVKIMPNDEWVTMNEPRIIKYRKGGTGRSIVFECKRNLPNIGRLRIKTVNI